WFSQRPILLPRLLRVASAALALCGTVWFAVRATDSLRAPGTPQLAAATAPTAAPAPNAASGSHRQAPETPASIQRLCSALHELPRVRRAECTGEKPGVALTGTC